MSQAVRMRTLVALVAGALVLTACGGGATFGGGIGGTGKPGIKFGGVDAGAGLSVGGTLFDAALATVQIDGEPALPADVRDGHVALVEGLIDDKVGVAETVTIETVVKGVLEAKLDASRLLVQGQKVAIDENTVFDSGINPASPDGLIDGDLLKIYGFVRGPGSVLATRVERVASLSEIRIVGVAQNVEQVNDRFAIGQQPIDHGTADVSDLPGGDPSDGQLVRVKGESMLGSVGEVVATQVEPLGLAGKSDNDETEIEGFVTAILSLTEVRVGSITVRTDGATRFKGGLPEDVVVGTRIEVEGALDMGVLSARELEFGSPVELESDVDRIVGDAFTLVGFPNLVITVSSLTEFEDEAASFSDIEVGDHVKLRGRKTGSSSVVAARVKETSADTDVVFQGPVDPSPTPQNPFVSVLGVLINTSGIDDDEFESPENEVIGRAAFFAALHGGTLVKFQGELIGDAPVWDEAELENGDG